MWEQSFSLLDTLTEAGAMDPGDIARQRNLVLCRPRLSDGTLGAAFDDSVL